jgi:hypothetical protein
MGEVYRAKDTKLKRDDARAWEGEPLDFPNTFRSLRM